VGDPVFWTGEENRKLVHASIFIGADNKGTGYFFDQYDLGGRYNIGAVPDFRHGNKFHYVYLHTYRIVNGFNLQ